MAVTQEQIDKWRKLNQQYKAWEITAQEAQNQMADELYKRDPNKLQNADVNVSQYGDDHSAQNYNNPDMWGWENNKYTWEDTKNSYTAYDPNATTEWLDPNYQYWRNAQMANSQNANYIANRNDQIASALYNEWKTSIEDVANFLRTQRGFDNSTENERQNTIYSVWKRLGEIAKENEKNDTNNQSDINNQQAMENIQNDLQQQGGMLYGRSQADENDPVKWIQTLQDPYSVDRAMAESRVANLRSLQTMDSQAIAASIISWTTPYGEQAMRDLMQYNPQKYEEVQTAIKQLKWQMNINSITSGEWEVSTVINTTASDITTFAENNANDMTSVWQILKDVKSTLASNSSASTAQEQMDLIKIDIENLQNRLKNLNKEASQVFKWDVPQYIINAYKSNRTAEINDQLQILENRRNSAYNVYQTEWEQTKFMLEYGLKQDEMQMKKESATLDNYLTKLNIKNLQNELWTNMSEAEMIEVFNNFIETYTEWEYWWQCGAFVKRYLSQLWINLPNISSIDSKMSLIDDSITEPTEWDIVIMTSPTHPENWHMAIVSSVDDNWTIHLLESNWNWDEKVHTTRTVKPWDSQILGYYRPSTNSRTSWWPTTYTNDYGQTFDLTKYSDWNKLSVAEQELVKNALNLQVDVTKLAKSWQNWKSYNNIIAAVTTIDPTFQTRNYEVWTAVAKKWAVSKQAWWEASRNATSMAVLKDISTMYERLSNGDLQYVNEVVNRLKTQNWDPTVAWIATDINIAAYELAGALKWNASPTDQDVKDMKKLLKWKLSNAQFEETISKMVNALYEKNNTEARGFYQDVWYKPTPIWTPEVADWMNSVMWIDLSMYYNYWVQRNDIPNGWNSTSIDAEINSIINW